MIKFNEKKRQRVVVFFGLMISAKIVKKFNKTKELYGVIRWTVKFQTICYIVRGVLKLIKNIKHKTSLKSHWYRHMFSFAFSVGGFEFILLRRFFKSRLAVNKLKKA